MKTRPHKPMYSARRPAERAFSLLEILIAIAILVIGMVGVLAAFTAAMNLHKWGMDQTSAALLAQTLLDEAQAAALEGKTAAEITRPAGGDFAPSPNYPPCQYRVTCTELNSREYKLIVEVRLRPPSESAAAAGEPGWQDRYQSVLQFDAILLRR